MWGECVRKNMKSCKCHVNCIKTYHWCCTDTNAFKLIFKFVKTCSEIDARKLEFLSEIYKAYISLNKPYKLT